MQLSQQVATPNIFIIFVFSYFLFSLEKVKWGGEKATFDEQNKGGAVMCNNNHVGHPV